MSIISSGLGWSCNEEFLAMSAGRIATINNRGYYKTSDIPAICGVHYNSSNYTMPFLLSTEPEAISLRADSGGPWTHNISFEYLGMTWYYNWGEHGFYNAMPTSPYPVLDTRNIGAYNSVEVALYILEQAGAMLTAPHYNVEFDAAGGYGPMPEQAIYCGESTPLTENAFIRANHVFIGWDTSEAAATVVYDDGQEVVDIAEEDETITLYAVWRKTWAWLIGDADNHVYSIARVDGEQLRVPLSDIGSLTASVFCEYGFQFNPDSTVLIDLPSPKIYKWSEDYGMEIVVDVAAVPIVPKPVTFRAMELESPVKYINIAGDSNTLWNVSFDNGNTWYKYDGGWVAVTEDGDGCLKRRLEILTASDWAEKNTNGTLVFRCWLYADSWVKLIRVDY